MNPRVSRKSTTRWNLFFLYLRLFIGIANGLLIVPLYLKFIGASLFGAWLVTGNILAWITIVEPGVGDVLTQKISVAFSQHKKDDLEHLLGSGFVISLSVAILALLLCFGLSYFLGSIIQPGSKIDINILRTAFLLTGIGTCSTLFMFFFSGSVIGFQETKVIGLLQTIIGILGIVLNVILLFLGFGLYSIAFAQLFKGVVLLLLTIVFFIFLLRRYSLKMRLSLTHFKTFSRIFTFTFMSKIVSTVSGNVDLIIISRYVGTEYVTVFELTRRPMRILQGFINNFTISLLPAFAHMYGEGDKDKIRRNVIRVVNMVMWILILFVFLFITFNRNLIGLWIGDKFYAGNAINTFLCISIFLVSMSYNLSNLTYSMGNIKGNSIVDSMKNALYILFLFILSYYFHIWGIVLAGLFASLVTEFWYYPLKTIKLGQFEKGKSFSIIKTSVLMIIISAILAVVFMKFHIHGWIELIVAGSGYSLLYLGSLWFLSRDFRNEIIQFIGSVRSMVVK